jgi:hypothetical protein
MPPCCSHNIFHEIWQLLPFAPLALLTFHRTFRSGLEQIKLFGQRFKFFRESH